MTGLTMIFLSFLCLLVATTRGLPQPHQLPRRAARVPQDGLHPLARHQDIALDTHAPVRAWKRTGSTGVGEQASVSATASNAPASECIEFILCDKLTLRLGLRL